ncbi:MAG: hypothetical protein HY360_26270 [Verrucomicrobia bacterium]|nr:hypothetical protein [Verrucomicrobiota bacterium]
MKTLSKTEAYESGRAAGKAARNHLKQEIKDGFQSARKSFPASANLDYADALVKLDRERIAHAPSLTRFPETKGLPDLLIAERKGFLDGSGGGPLELAFRYSWWFFQTRRLQTRYMSSSSSKCPKGECTAVFISNSKEGGPLFGRNWDEPNRPLPWFMGVPSQGPDHVQRLAWKGVSAGTLCDEEPTEIFPLNPFDILPDDCRKVEDVAAFLQRYADFWGPNNGIIVDDEDHAVAYEKLNCRMGVRYSEDGSAAVTACAVVIPEIKAFRDQIHRKSMELRGMDVEHSTDAHYWKGCEARYRRLLKLTAAASRNAATLQDMAAIVTDHAAPYPERICIAGQTCHPDLKSEDTEWTMTSRAMVLSGANRRVLYYRVEGNQACYENPPFLVLGKGVALKPEWLKGTRSDPSYSNPVSCMPEAAELNEDSMLKLYSDRVWRK